MLDFNKVVFGDVLVLYTLIIKCKLEIHLGVEVEQKRRLKNSPAQCHYSHPVYRYLA